MRNGTLGRNCTKLIKCLLEAVLLSFEKCLTQMAFLSSWIEHPTQVALNWRVCRFDPISILFTPKWYEWVWYEILWENDMKWHIKWHDVWCNAWNARCSRNANCATCVICVRCVWYVQWNIWNMTWNDAKCNIKRHEMMHEITCNMRCMQCRSFISVTCNEMQPWILISVTCNEM